VRLNDGKNGVWQRETAISAADGGRRRVQPTCIAFRIALDAPKGSSDGRNPGNVGSELPSRAPMATVMGRTGGDPGQVGQYRLE